MLGIFHDLSSAQSLISLTFGLAVSLPIYESGKAIHIQPHLRLSFGSHANLVAPVLVISILTAIPDTSWRVRGLM